MNSSLSRKILIGIGVLFLLSFFGAGMTLTAYTALIPFAVTRGLEAWRVVTYPFGVDFLGILLGFICFSAPAEEVEQMLGTRSFGLLLLAITLICALMHLVMFMGGVTPLAGPVNIALFVLIGFAYIYPHSEIRLFIISVRSWVILAFAGATVIFVTVMNVTKGSSPFIIFSNGGYGIILGAVYFHVRFQKYNVLLGLIRGVERMLAGGRQQAAFTPSVPQKQRRAVVQPVSRMRNPFQKPPSREISDEERLNTILDKINDSGYDSLGDDEQKFLREYSSRMNPS